MAKRVWRRERDLTGWMSLSRKPEMTWYGWDGEWRNGYGGGSVT
ncbi:protein rhsD%2C truncation [Escherichia coli]|nr:protein rhsD%2C truncation [Escherichia coli]